MAFLVLNSADEQIGPPLHLFKHAREYADLNRKVSVARGGDEHYHVTETRPVYTTSTLSEAIAEDVVV